MRGKEAVLCVSARDMGITPAHAGKRKSKFVRRQQREDHPRACGEKAANFRAECGPKGSPPRMRGKGDCPSNRRFAVGITPAYAGKSGTVPRPDALNEDHPRACGEKQFSCIVPLGVLGSPPRMRGKGWAGSPWGSISGITPAHAGKRDGIVSGIDFDRDHPRACGEKQSNVVCPLSSRGSPPRMRGKA